jgi:arylacetamide deacetylase-like 3/4
LAVVISQKLIEENLIKPKLQVLVYPILQFIDFTLPSYKENLPKRILGNIDHENFVYFLTHFTGHPIDDSIFSNAHTTEQHKKELYKYVDRAHIPDEFKTSYEDNYQEHLNDTCGKFSQVAEILLDNDVSPLLVDDDYLRTHTPTNTFIMTVQYDILRDESFIYAERLKRLNLNVHHKHYENLFHGIFGLLHGPLEFSIAHDLVKTVAEFIKATVNS